MTDLSILIADANEIRVDRLRRFIADLGIRNLVEAVHESGALQTLLQKRMRIGESALPLFLLLDSQFFGASAISSLRSQPALERVPIVVVQPGAQIDLTHEFMEAGVDACIYHPPSAAALTFVYDRARQIREGSLKRRWAFNTLPDGVGGAVTFSFDRELDLTT